MSYHGKIDSECLEDGFSCGDSEGKYVNARHPMTALWAVVQRSLGVQDRLKPMRLHRLVVGVPHSASDLLIMIDASQPCIHVSITNHYLIDNTCMEKIDFKKAYDTVRWDFLEEVTHKSTFQSIVDELHWLEVDKR